MRYWVFSEEQLERALQEYMARTNRDIPLDREKAIIDFLESPEARKNKLQGGASYTPEEPQA